MGPSSKHGDDNMKLYVGQSYELSLTSAVEALFQSVDEEDAGLAGFVEQFYELMQARLDPPLEAIWIYCALKFNGSHLSGKEFPAQISLVKAQFQFITACSAACGASKSIALLAPVCLWIYGVFVHLFSADLDSKALSKMNREVRSLVDLILGYVGVCCAKGSNDGEVSSRLVRPLEDLLALWMEDRTGTALLTCSFPSLTSEIRQQLSKVGCGVGELAGAVAAELFFMRVGLSIQVRDGGPELERELKSWAVASLTGSENVDLFEILLQVLLEPEPVTGSLSSKSGDLIRRVLYDVLLVDYDFLNLDSANHASAERLKNISLMRLLVAFEAVELFRQGADQSKAISYTNAFSTSRLPTQIIKLVPGGMGLSKTMLSGSSPKALIKWILDLERQGVRVFHESIAKYAHKSALKLGHDRPTGVEAGGKDVDADGIMFSIDKEGEKDTDSEQELDTVSKAFVAAAHTMSAPETKTALKRKRGLTNKKQQTRSPEDSDPSDSSEGKSSDIDSDAGGKSSDNSDIDNDGSE